MTIKHKPQNYSSVSPYLIVKDANATINFLKEVFNGNELRRFEDDNGGIMHSEVKIDDSVIMIADSTNEWQPVPSYVHVYVDNVDETYRRAIAYGAESVQEPSKGEDEDKRGGIKDVGGTTWWIATRVE